MKYFAPPVEKLIEQFERLPGIGYKTAQRLAFFVLDLPKDQAEEFAKAILDAKQTVHTCKVCQNLTDGEICSICSVESESPWKKLLISVTSSALCFPFACSTNFPSFSKKLFFSTR